MARKPVEGMRERILDTAVRLFSANGVHAVGLQQIIDECGCGKNLLYREFACKDDLVAAYLERCRLDWQRIFDEATQPLAGDPAAQMVAVVRAIAEKATVAGSRGCALRNTHAEFPDARHPAHQVAVNHFNSMRAQLLDLAEQAHAKDPRTLADRVMLIIDGLYANGAVLGSGGAAPAAVAFAEEIVRAETNALIA